MVIEHNTIEFEPILTWPFDVTIFNEAQILNGRRSLEIEDLAAEGEEGVPQSCN